jgi:hypothetical protein
MVTNIPQNMRTPRMLRWYFGRYLPEPAGQGDSGDGLKKGRSWRKLVPVRRKTADIPIEPKPHDGKLHKLNPAVGEGKPLDPDIHVEAAAREFEINLEDASRVNIRGMELVENIVLAPKLSGMAELIKKREEALEELEGAHITLAKAVMTEVGKEIGRRAREENRKGREGEIRRRERVREEVQRQGGQVAAGDGEDGGGRLGGVRDRLERAWWVVERLVWGEPDRSREVDELVIKIGPFVEKAQQRDAQYGVRVWARGVSAWVRSKLEEKRKVAQKGEEEEVDGSGGGSPVDEVKKRQHTTGEGNGYADGSSGDAKSPTSPTSPTSQIPPSPTMNGHNSPTHRTTLPGPDAPSPSNDTVWSALHSLPSTTLHRFLPYTRKRSIFLYPLELVGLLAPTALPTIDLSFFR